MRLGYARYNVLSHHPQDDEGCSKAHYKEYARINNDMQKVSVIFWMVAFGGIVRLAHVQVRCGSDVSGIFAVAGFIATRRVQDGTSGHELHPLAICGDEE